MEDQYAQKRSLGPRPARQLTRLAASRDGWQQRCRHKQEEIRALRVRVRDLEQSRDHWRQRAMRADQDPPPGE